MTVPKDPSAPCRLPCTGNACLENAELDTTTQQRVPDRQPTDPGTDQGDLDARNAHASTVRLSTWAR
jgi:hypothetical protein